MRGFCDESTFGETAWSDFFAFMALLLVSEPSFADDYDAPTQLVLKVPEISKKELQRGQSYASCMSTPWLPTADQFDTKARSCADLRLPRSSKLKEAMGWVDHVATRFSGAEMELRIQQQ